MDIQKTCQVYIHIYIFWLWSMSVYLSQIDRYSQIRVKYRCIYTWHKFWIYMYIYLLQSVSVKQIDSNLWVRTQHTADSLNRHPRHYRLVRVNVMCVCVCVCVCVCNSIDTTRPFPSYVCKSYECNWIDTTRLSYECTHASAMYLLQHYTALVRRLSTLIWQALHLYEYNFTRVSTLL